MFVHIARNMAKRGASFKAIDKLYHLTTELGEEKGVEIPAFYSWNFTDWDFSSSWCSDCDEFYRNRWEYTDWLIQSENSQKEGVCNPEMDYIIKRTLEKEYGHGCEHDRIETRTTDLTERFI